MSIVSEKRRDIYRRAREEGAKRQRAERVMLAALDALLANRGFDFYWFDQTELTAPALLRGGHLDPYAVESFMDALDREFGSDK